MVQRQSTASVLNTSLFALFLSEIQIKKHWINQVRGEERLPEPSFSLSPCYSTEEGETEGDRFPGRIRRFPSPPAGFSPAVGGGDRRIRRPVSIYYLNKGL